MPQGEQTPGRDDRFAQQLKKGVLELLVLRLLAEKPSHGYELILRLREGSGGLLDLKEGTLYPILYRLEDDGCIQSEWRTPQTPRSRETASPMPRKIYRMTEKGLDTLKMEADAWQEFAACVTHFLEGPEHE